MYPRTEYEMSEEDLKALLQPRVPEIMIGGYSTSSMQQASANNAWAALGKKMGFDWETVRPVSGKGQRFFSAIPSETEEARNERLARLAEENKRTEIERLTKERDAISERLTKLLASVILIITLLLLPLSAQAHGCRHHEHHHGHHDEHHAWREFRERHSYSTPKPVQSTPQLSSNPLQLPCAAGVKADCRVGK